MKNEIVLVMAGIGAAAGTHCNDACGSSVSMAAGEPAQHGQAHLRAPDE
ncbi:hypothetical protein ACP_2821 [Acidobacterium capsulatum ATCC 51196]|uniref:Uncharacterized protein n=1 Tax=Acidobacterium capsulatum (strain ATCC 51196 / DSM 11244 / BCRC 80197 / JCM 7670 / NBRC 15755 / NCIMB 13165 / 161) TaxID=240015 RepID=C1F3C7_ACIC5|nr:hypothetical protein ACP_2821 [Acidobacterium capsulatum ATCC 51196]